MFIITISFCALIIDHATYLAFGRSRGYSIAQITSIGLKEMSDEELVHSPQIDILITKHLPQVISDYQVNYRM